MPSIEQSSVRNRLLSALPQDAFAALAPHFVAVDLPLRHSLVKANQPTDSFVFIENGLGSVVASSVDEKAVEVGHVGPEGVSAAHLFLGTSTTPNDTFMQVGGHGFQAPANILLDMTAGSPGLRDFFLRYVHSCEIQLAQSALANARYNMNARLARWLLMCHDRLDGINLPLTHEFLALMLGVRRSGVTIEIHVLEGLNAIRATRGNVRIRDRSKLEEIAAGCYGVAEAEYERLMGLPIKQLEP
jgi:CRP-like cAMP-binding protein